MDEQTKHLLTVRDVQHVLSFSRTRVYELLKNQELASTKVGRRRMLFSVSVQLYLDKLKC